MQRTFFGLFLIFISSTAFSQTISAGDLENLCAAKTEVERLPCLLVVKSYMDGFIEGVGKGVVETYQHDSQVFALVKDVPMKDMAPRIKHVADLATCIQRVSVTDMINSFGTFIRNNPSLRQKHYREALTRAIVATYCQK